MRKELFENTKNGGTKNGETKPPRVEPMKFSDNLLNKRKMRRITRPGKAKPSVK